MIRKEFRRIENIKSRYTKIPRKVVSEYDPLMQSTIHTIFADFPELNLTNGRITIINGFSPSTAAMLADNWKKCIGSILKNVPLSTEDERNFSLLPQ